MGPPAYRALFAVDPVGWGGDDDHAPIIAWFGVGIGMGSNRSEQSQDEWFWSTVDRYLKRQGLKQTRQRRAIMEAFLGSRRHVDAEELHLSMKRRGKSPGLATVYRTLHLLRDAGLAEDKSFGNGPVKFEPVHPDDHHDHLVCLDCGEIVEFANSTIERLQRAIAKEHGFRLKAHRLNLYGACQRENCDRR